MEAVPITREGGQGCFMKFPKPVREFLAAVILRQQNYWMTDEMRQESLGELGFSIDAEGNVLDAEDDTKLDTDNALEEGKKMLG